MYPSNQTVQIPEKASRISRFALIAVMLMLMTSAGFGQTNGPNQPTTSTSTKKDTPMDPIIIDLDALKKSNWSKQELENAALVIDFVQHIMNNHDFDYIQQKFGSHPYRQHNRNIPDGIDGLLSYIEQSAKRYPEFTYDVKHIYVDGNFVTLHSHATIKKKDRGNDKKGFNINDTWRVENGQLVEHWDAVQPINGSMRFFGWLTGGKVRNQNGVF